MTDKRHECDDLCDELDFTPPEPFYRVLDAEFEEIRARRNVDSSGTYPQDEQGRPRSLAAIALSGGGIRSATFCLGVLQALDRFDLLRRFDYLSTVSGGGYVGGWWSAWLSRSSRKAGEVFAPPERIEPERHAVRHLDMVNAYVADDARDHEEPSDSAINAGHDPIHHLRLFSNFLTPRKGLLSGDTWRAATTIGRNLILTWLVLLPIMLAAIMMGQAYFAILTGNDFECQIDLHEDIDTLAQSADPAQRAQVLKVANVGEETKDMSDRLLRRLVFALGPPAFLVIGIVLSVFLWILATRKCWKGRDIIIFSLSGAAFIALTVLLLQIAGRMPSLSVWLMLGLAALFFLLVLVLSGVRHAERGEGSMLESDFWRNRIVQFQTTLVQTAFLLTAVLLFSGFGHELIDFLVFDEQLHRWVGAEVIRAGGWGSIVLALLGAIYTALKASPSGGADEKKSGTSLFDRIVFAIVPPLVLFVLAVFLAWVGHHWYSDVYRDANGEIWWITIGTVISAFLFLAMAIYEFRPRSPQKMLVLVAVWLAVAIGVRLVNANELDANLLPVALGAIVFMVGAIIGRGPVGRRHWRVIALCAVAGIAVAVVARVWNIGQTYDPLPITQLPYVVLTGVLFAVTLLLFELLWGEGSNARSFALMLIGFGILGLAALADCAPDDMAWRAMAIHGCISTTLGWVLALGWLADPNVLTVHAFYKARLVRAYMGASNDERGNARTAEITDLVPGDDVLLKDLHNTEQGAPYHLINTTLNLVGARDLATVQRFSDSFTMSKRYCGSLRTGYRPTDQYACGTLSLGTAVSVSGAAASPNMGGMTPSAALAMLMTLFNIRLGFWSPTPSRGYWRAAYARLWPFYTIQELLSQTTDLLSFCYLTDGGHFENTGVYSLVQRGCRYIVYCDCGADPLPAFADLGNMIRKVRIDFGAEIDLDIESLLGSGPETHYIIGTIRYSDVHAESLGLAPDERVGRILVIKPNRAPGASVDVRQYGFENPDFPQQSTADQWYDEQQFESYRRLGAISAASVFARFAGERDAGALFDKIAAESAVSVV
jgi:hypothetical protein